jgi:hypothetical protein
MVNDSLDEFFVFSELVAKALKIRAGDLHTQIAQMTLKDFLQQ